MKKIIVLIMLLPLIALSQQLNHTWGETTTGTAYTQTGYNNADSSTTITAVFDLQDWYPLDMNQVAFDSVTALGSSNKMLIGTLWYRIDAVNATDSVGYAIKTYPGNLVYYPGTGERIATANINYSTTATTLIDTATTKAVNDIQWSFVNVFLNTSTDASSVVVKHLPTEFFKATWTFQLNAADSLDVYWDFVYPASKQTDQEKRTSTNKGNAKKDARTLK
jgi:hypothetical protein